MSDDMQQYTLPRNCYENCLYPLPYMGVISVSTGHENSHQHTWKHTWKRKEM